MTLIVKLIISLVIAAVAFTLSTLLQEDNAINLSMLAAMCLATVATALIVTAPAPSSPGNDTAAAAKPRPAKAKTKAKAGSDGNREQGEVKWFNVSKGFGFITKDDGEEIFVHFRSIRGEGRRGLRDGERVSFVVAQSDKGPQAEDVEGLG